MTDVHPLGVHPPGVHPPGVHPPGVHPLGVHPPGVHPPGTSPPGDDTGKVERWCPLPPYVDLAARHLQATGQWAGLVQAATDEHLRLTMARVLATEEDLDCPPDDIAFFESTEQALAHLATTLEAGSRRGLVLVTVPRTPGGSLPTNEEWAALTGFCRELGLDLVADETKGWPAEDTDCVSASLLRNRRLPEHTWVLRDIPELDHVAPVVYLLRGASPRTWPHPAPLPGDTRALLALLLSTTRDHRDVARNRLRAERGRLRWSPPPPPIG